jgi:tetratricopeptide (TPR) repeat protein
MACYSKALAIRPRYVEALFNRASAARRLKLYKNALADYAGAKRENPSFPYLDGYVAHTRAQACDWSRHRRCALSGSDCQKHKAFFNARRDLRPA